MMISSAFLIGLVQDNITFFDPEFHRREMTVISSRNATRADFDHLVASIEAGEVDVRPWITHRSGPDEMIGVYESWLDPESGVVKAMLEF